MEEEERGMKKLRAYIRGEHHLTSLVIPIKDSTVVLMNCAYIEVAFDKLNISLVARHMQSGMYLEGTDGQINQFVLCCC